MTESNRITIHFHRVLSNKHNSYENRKLFSYSFDITLNSWTLKFVLFDILYLYIYMYHLCRYIFQSKVQEECDDMMGRSIVGFSEYAVKMTSRLRPKIKCARMSLSPLTWSRIIKSQQHFEGRQNIMTQLQSNYLLSDC